ncbi:MAG: polysaccharide pyruvyl transferase family protein [Bdellovibrionales bacterium]
MKQPIFLFLTAHDYRTPRKAWMQFMAEELIKIGKVRFFSLRYSWLSKYRPDGRHIIAACANKLEQVNGIDCYLWKTLVHPVNTHRIWLRPLETIAFKLYVLMAPALMKQWIREADTIFFESGASPAFFGMAKKLNPSAKMIYLTSDTLDSIHVAQYIKDTVRRISAQFDHCWLPSKLMTEDFGPGAKLFYVPQGIDASIENFADPSPYGPGRHAVSIGSMLFDESFFEIAGSLFPDVTFHVIGCGRERPPKWLANVIHYDEMKFNDTIPFIKYADFALAPYLPESIPASLADTSMKLFQYAFFGVPAVCPFEVVGDHPHRFGYRPKDAASIGAAITAALKAGKSTGIKVLNWKEVTERIVDPHAFGIDAIKGREAHDAQAFIFIETQFDNLGDALINREMIKLMSRHATVTAGILRVPASFKSMIGNEFLNTVRLDRTSDRSLFLLKVLLKTLKGEKCFVFLSPGGWIGELDGRLNLRSWLHTGLYYLLKAGGVKICQLGVSYENPGPKLSRLLRARSGAMYRHYVRDTLSQKVMSQLFVRIDGICPDLAFYAFDGDVPKNNPKAITFSFRSDQYPGQLDDIKAFIALILKECGDAMLVYFVTQVKKDNDTNFHLARWLSERHGIKAEVCDGSLNITATEELYRRSTIVVSNRLHALLLAGSVGNAMVAAPIGAHNKKIESMFRDIGLEKHVFGWSAHDQEQISARLREVLHRTFDARVEKHKIELLVDEIFTNDKANS